jgi:AraC-like DNA-binding protein
MPGSATFSFTEPDAFRTALGLLGIRVFVAMPGEFSARLTHAALPHVHLLRVTETLPRIAYFALPPDAVCISFPTQADPRPVWAGEEQRFGDIVFHGRGQRLHQWTRSPIHWGLIAVDSGLLARYGKAHYEIDFVASSDGRALRPSQAAWTRLLKLHTSAGRVVETRPSTFVHAEAARALEHDLIHALADCLAEGEWLEGSPARREPARIMQRFEDELAAWPQPNVGVAEICAVLGVLEQTLRLCCRQFLGMAPARYLDLRRLARMRSALLDADQRAVSVAEVARRHGFASTGPIAAAYRTAFGETPSMTLKRAGPNWG